MEEHLVVKETKQEYKERWRSIRILYLTMFFDSLCKFHFLIKFFKRITEMTCFMWPIYFSVFFLLFLVLDSLANPTLSPFHLYGAGGGGGHRLIRIFFCRASFFAKRVDVDIRMNCREFTVLIEVA